MTDEMLESIRKKAEAFPVLAIEREEHFVPADVIVTPIEDFMLAKVGQTYPRDGGQVFLGHTEASFKKAEAEFIAEARGDILALVAEVKRLRAALGIVVRDHEAGLLCCEANGNTAEVVRICREALEGKEVTGL